MHKRRDAAERRVSSDKDQGADNNCEWQTRTAGIISPVPYICSPPGNTDTNEQDPPTDEFIMSDIYDTSSHMNTEGSVDVWSRELYRIIMNPGDIGSFPGENQDTLSDISSRSSSSPGLPDLPILEEQVPNQRTTTTMLETPAESLWGEDKADSTSPGGEIPVCDSPSANPIGARTLGGNYPVVCREPTGLSVELVPFYFNVVCPILSTFDSEKNVFRTFVSKKWQDSVTMHYTIQSMAAAKLVWFMPDMRAHALEYRSLALGNLQKEISAASCWDTELLFIVLLLGISSCWFDITDLGIAHLQAIQKALLNGKVKFSDDFDTAGFFRNALTYWEMVSCAVSDTVTYNDYDNMELEQPEEPKPQPPTRQRAHESPARIVPHPWTGVASEPQAIFTRILRQIHGLRTSGSTSTAVGLRLDRPTDFLETVRGLDEAIWSYSLPNLHDIGNIDDPNTPAVHHLLLAEAYMFANLYQLYCVFSNVRRKRVMWMKETAALRQFGPMSWAGAQVCSWTRILQQEDGTEKWQKFLGHSIIIRLEQIQTSSGTSCVQGLLLLVAATSLSLNTEVNEEEEEKAEGKLRQEVTTYGQEEILRARRFVLDRLNFLCVSNLSTPIQHVRNVVVEIFKRLDVGADVFWLDVLQSIGLLTIIG